MGTPVLIVYLEISTRRSISRIMSSLVTFLLLLSFTLLPAHSAPSQPTEECHEENGFVKCCREDKQNWVIDCYHYNANTEPEECHEKNGFIVCCGQEKNGARYCYHYNTNTQPLHSGPTQPTDGCHEENGVVKC